MRHELWKIADVRSAGSRIVPFFGREVHVYRDGDKTRVGANICLHFGGPLECKEGELICPWHNASFDMATGDRLDRPAPSGSRLMFLPTTVEHDAPYYVWAE